MQWLIAWWSASVQDTAKDVEQNIKLKENNIRNISALPGLSGEVCRLFVGAECRGLG